MRRCERGGGGGVGDVDRKSVSVNFMIAGERVLRLVFAWGRK